MCAHDDTCRFEADVVFLKACFYSDTFLYLIFTSQLGEEYNNNVREAKRK